ncbi:LacI family DNA-binding transcriptional regulator [Spelaeicoccus albus]|uniref:LacI family transcriptional regulator n=1 Tax=Spelaeicoccus albus TaxID=1280376 RepID=A0A7Z0D2K1_9MICO|nr:LacI family DNA-binding transcriptional regulator [Spelaeicoccus albus]NYI67706.1 LacI family transcriptional regulator [Spelaeicoccus albus]
MVKIRDVALHAGVSVATVSRALNNYSTVAPELVSRVRDSAEKLGYRPNALARSLRRQTTRVWSLIVTDIDNPFYTALARGVEDIARDSGYSVLLCNSDEDAVRERDYLQVAEQEQAAGVIIAPSGRDTDVSRLIAARIPIVAIDRTMTADVDIVRTNSGLAARAATEHLLAAGWRHPACITGPADSETAEDRYRGYREAALAAGVEPLARHVPFHSDGGTEAVAELLGEDDPPDSFFVANSVLALGVLDELRRRKVAVGADVGLVMFDEAPWAPLLSPAITVLTQPAYDIGAEAARLLVARIGAPEGAPHGPKEIVLPTTLVVRESSQRAV